MLCSLLNRMFEERCISLMDKTYEENETIAITSLIETRNIWGIRSSPLTFAYENFMYDIIAHPCSQKYMNNQWRKNQNPDRNSFVKVTLIYMSKQIKKNIQELKIQIVEESQRI